MKDATQTLITAISNWAYFAFVPTMFIVFVVHELIRRKN
jgi:hypothetical protein